MKKVIVTGGGTGGHLYPALAIIEAIKAFCDVIYVGHPQKIEAKIVPSKGINFHPIKSFPVSKNPIQLLRIISSIIKGIFYLRKIKPDLVIGVGGYVSIPITISAKLLRIPVVMQEQNVHPGKANRLLIKLGVPVMLGFEETKNLIKLKEYYVTGCPVRATIGTIDKCEAKASLNLIGYEKILLIVGGSGGAKAINDIGLKLIEYFRGNGKVFIILVTGKSYYKEVCEKIKNISVAGVPDLFKIIEYADNIDSLFAASDITICRSGSSTINELLCSGVPSVLIPSPNVAENHQEANARYLERIGAGIVCLERDISEKFSLMVDELIFDDSKLYQMHKANIENCMGRLAKNKIAAIVKGKLAL